MPAALAAPRAARLSGFIENTFTPALRQHLQARQIEKLLYDEHNLQALIQHCAGRLQRNFSPRDRLFCSCLCNIRFAIRASPPSMRSSDSGWKSGAAGGAGCYSPLAAALPFCTRRQRNRFFTLLFSMIHAPPSAAQQLWEQQLLEQTRLLIARFQAQSGMRFSDERGLCSQLYTHLAQALDRCHFAVGIDKSLSEEVIRLYPRLLRATRTAIEAFENHYGIRFSAEELGLIAVIFGAWLMQENALQEKQVLLLTGENAALESRLEEQLRELTLLPLSVKYLPMRDFQRDGAPKG